MSIKIDMYKKLEDRRFALWQKFGKVVSKQLEFMKKFDSRAYNLGLDVIEGIHQPEWIDTKKKPPMEGTNCIIEYKGEICTSFFENNQFNTRKGSFKPEDIIQWYPYPNNPK